MRAKWWDRNINIRKFRTTDFCLLSNNCWASMHFYQRFGLEYNIPVVGLYISDHDFIKFCNNLEYYLSLPIVFVSPETSPAYNEICRWGSKSGKEEKIEFPVGMIGDITLWFMHYKSEQEAREKWYRRRARLNPDKVIIKWSQRYTDDDLIVEDFLKLPYPKFGFVDDACQIESPELIKLAGWTELKDTGGDEIGFSGRNIDTIKIINDAFDRQNNKSR